MKMMEYIQADQWMRIICTLGAGAVGGVLLWKLRVPGGMLVGSIIGAAIFNIATGCAHMPSAVRFFSHVVAGAYIGSTMEQSAFKRIPQLAKPLSILLGGYLLTNILIGILVYRVSPLDATTSLFACVPGGMADTTVISIELGADGGKVVVLQFVRMLAGLGLFPGMIRLVDRRLSMKRGEAGSGEPDKTKPDAAECAPEMSGTKEAVTPKTWLLTMAVATVAGLLGYASGIPAGDLAASLIAVGALHAAKGCCGMTVGTRRVAQALVGAYIGCRIGYRDVLELRHLALPAIVIVCGYILFCFADAALLMRFCGFERKKALLCATPAGASDMALISADIGVVDSDLIFMQIVRLICVVLVFPQALRLVAAWLG